jgi:hypothetical protein
MDKPLNGKTRFAFVVSIALAAGVCTACNSTPKVTIPATPPPSAALSPEAQNNPNVPAFIKNGGLDQLHKQMLDHARMMQEAERKKTP